MGTQRAERRENDHYVTPDWAIRRFLERYKPAIGEGVRILDPCAAKGELITAAKPFFPQALFAACEINPAFEAELAEVTSGAALIGNFLENVEVLRQLDIDFVLTNPPYNQAEEFIRASLELGGSIEVAMLLRVNFLAGRGRRDFLAGLKPSVFVLPNRPSFTGGGGDMTEYGWFVFGGVQGHLEILENTPADEISAANKRARLIHAPAHQSVWQCAFCGTWGPSATCADCGQTQAAATS